MINIQPGSTTRVRKSAVRGNQGNGGGQFVSWFTALCKATLLLGVIATIFHTYISLHQQISVAEKESAKIKKEIEAVEREIAQQRSLYATRSSESYLMAQIRRFRLPLEAPKDGQLRRMSILPPEQAVRVVNPRMSAMRKVALERRKSAARRIIAGN